MKNTSLMRAVVTIVLCLLLVIGSIVVTIAAVKDNLAVTGSEITSGSLDTRKTYYIGGDSSSYTLVYNNGWKVSNGSGYLRAQNIYSTTYVSASMATSFTVSSPSSSGVTIYGNGLYVTYSSSLELSNSSSYVHIYDPTASPATEAPTEAPTEPVEPVTTDANIVTIFFTNSHNGGYWSNVYAYAWNSSDSDVKNAAWPGEAATYYGNNDSNQGLYTFSFDVNKYDRLIFGNNTDDQTEDIHVDELVAAGYNAVYFTYNNSNLVSWYTYTYTSAVTVTEITDGTLDSSATYYCGTNDGAYKLVNVRSGIWKIQRTSDNYYANFDGRTSERTWVASGGTELTEGTHVSSHNFPGWRFSFVQNNQTYYVYYDPSSNFVTAQNNQYGIPIYEVSGGGSGSGSGSGSSSGSETYSFAVTQKLTTDSGSSWSTISANTITQSQSSGISAGSNVVLSQSATIDYDFLGWYVDGIQVSTDSEVTFSNIRSNYPSVNASNNNSSVLVVEARYVPSVKGSYIFKYTDRYGIQRTKTVAVKLCSDEKTGYSGNNNQQNVPTYLWTAEAQALYATNPLITASLAVTRNPDYIDNVSVYKNDIEWDLEKTTVASATNMTADTENKTLTVTADVTPVKFTFKYVINNGSVSQGAANVPYGKVVTFNPTYSSSAECQYVDYSVPAENFSYWSSDTAGNNVLTTNRNFGMKLRGGSADANKIITVYAQYNKPIPENKWLPEFEEATLTRTISDDTNVVYADYMTNYFNYEGTAVQDLIDAGNNKIRYGLIVVKYSDYVDAAFMQSALTKMVNASRTSAYIGDTEHIAYRYEYSDKEHISNFNRTLYTLSSSFSAMEGKKLTAMAYITLDGTNYYYSAVNTDISVSLT